MSLLSHEFLPLADDSLHQYFSRVYPGSLHTLSGSTSDEVGTPPENDRVALTASKLWPQLQSLVQPYGLHKRETVLTQGEVEGVRTGADDLTDPEDLEKKGAEQGRREKASVDL